MIHFQWSLSKAYHRSLFLFPYHYIYIPTYRCSMEANHLFILLKSKFNCIHSVYGLISHFSQSRPIDLHMNKEPEISLTAFRRSVFFPLTFSEWPACLHQMRAHSRLWSQFLFSILPCFPFFLFHSPSFHQNGSKQRDGNLYHAQASITYKKLNKQV